MRDRLRSGLGVVSFLAGPTLAVLALHRLGSVPWMAIDWSDIPGWFGRATLEEALAAVLRLAGLAVGYWLAGSTALYLMAGATRIPSLIQATGAITLPAVRRLVDGVVISTIAMSSLAAPLVATPSETASSVPDASIMVLPPPQQVPEERPAPGVGDTPVTSAFPAAASPTRTSDIDAPVRAAMEVIVRSGDNLWVLSERHLAEVLGRPPRHREVDPYWRRVIAVNLDRIRSRDPDLIYPGEVIVLPAVEG